ncbi:MAG: hypothetical protein ACKPHU_20460, partial [Planctomycetaceae bacterium]
LTRELPADAGVAAAGGRPIELMGFNGEGADASGFLETLETPPPQARVTKRTAPAVAESGAGAGGKVRKPVSRPAAAKAPAAARAPAAAERSVAVEGSAVAAAGPQQPMASMEWVYPKEMTPGVECTVRLVVRNSGSATLFGAVADVLCPSDVE